MKQKYCADNHPANDDAKLLKEWRKTKALQTTKEIGISLLCGMINGLSMYGRIAPSIFLSAPPLVKEEDFYTYKKK